MGSGSSYLRWPTPNYRLGNLKRSALHDFNLCAFASLREISVLGLRVGRAVLFCGYFSDMPPNKVLEELLGDDLAQVRGITEKAMFGGWAWLLNGNLLCGARNDGMLMRLGKGNDAWALAMPGIEPMMMQGRQMQGWVRAAPQVYEDDMLRRKLLKAALDFTRSLPKK